MENNNEVGYGSSMHFVVPRAGQRAIKVVFATPDNESYSQLYDPVEIERVGVSTTQRKRRIEPLHRGSFEVGWTVIVSRRSGRFLVASSELRDVVVGGEQTAFIGWMLSFRTICQDLQACQRPDGATRGRLT